jgi:regulator of protease activity HflC (stomatin/prohibitin superfamily)
MEVTTILLILSAAVVLALVSRRYVRRLILFEYQTGLKYSKGKLVGTLGAGRHWYTPLSSVIRAVDRRERFVSIPGQEVLTSDSVTIKLSLAARYEVSDPVVAINQIENYEQALYLELQLALRRMIGNLSVDELLEHRGEFGARLQEACEEKTSHLGVRLISVDVKDVMFPGPLKQIFTQVVKAQKEGLAALERARGETAALRNLANAARMVDDNPSLMQLRVLQSLGESTGNTLVWGMAPEAVALRPNGSGPTGTNQGGDPEPQG